MSINIIPNKNKTTSTGADYMWLGHMHILTKIGMIGDTEVFLSMKCLGKIDLNLSYAIYSLSIFLLAATQQLFEICVILDFL